METKHPNQDIILKAGDKARDFSLPDTDGTIVVLSAILQNGPAVVLFYRGDW